MIRIEFEVNGRKYSDVGQANAAFSKANDEFMAGIFEEIGESIADQLRSVRCSVHGEQPTVRLKAVPGQDFPDIDVSGCCEKLIKDATDAIS